MFKIGDKVQLTKKGMIYRGSVVPSKIWYCKIFHPINAQIINPNEADEEVEINTNCKYNSALRWKVRYNGKFDKFKGIYIISSDKNHMLVVSERAIEKV